jgi:stearoyl-CoA desaturase (delta-9 desaturase)
MLRGVRMPETASAPSAITRTPAWLLEPTYGWADPNGRAHRPSVREALVELADSVNPFMHRQRVLPLVFFVFHAVTGVLFVASFVFITWWTLLWAFAVHQIVSLVYQTFWYHRYCSHGAFRFSSLWFPRLLLWTNPVVLKEETYTIAHRIHHRRPDCAGDPYGPHLGWVGSYLSWESLYKTNTDMGEREYEALSRSFRHLGMPVNDYERFRRTGSIEQLWHYALRTITAQVLFIATSYALGGLPFVLSGYAGIFVFTFLLREFAWRGHGGDTPRPKRAGWEFDTRSRSTNHRFFGYLAGEWHDNHHRLPTSANCAILPGQVDVVFLFIRLLHGLRIVTSYRDTTPSLRAALAAGQSGRESATPPDEAEEVFFENW